VFEEPLRFDVLIEDCLLLELKCVQEILPIHKAQLLSYMKLLDIPLGLIINFHELKADRWRGAPDSARSKSLSRESGTEGNEGNEAWTTESLAEDAPGKVLCFLRCLGVEDHLSFRRNKIFAVVFVSLNGIFEP